MKRNTFSAVKWLRRLHTYLGCFFAPLLLFFVLTGWYQTLSVNRQKGEGELGDWKARLASVNVDQIVGSSLQSTIETFFYCSNSSL